MGLVSLSGMTGMGREKERKVLSDALSRATNVGRSFQREKKTERQRQARKHIRQSVWIYIYFLLVGLHKIPTSYCALGHKAD